MLKRASNALFKAHRVAEKNLVQPQVLSLAVRNVLKYPAFSSLPKYNHKVLNLTSFTRQNFASLPTHQKLAMPALSPTMEQGNIIKWTVKVGDKVGPGDQICDVETDKATLGFEMQDEGYVAAILVPEGTKGVKVGTPIVVLVDKEADVKAFANYKEGDAPKAEAKETPKKSAETAAPQKPAETAAPKKPAASAQSYPSHSKVDMPALSPTMETGKITQWLKKAGDKVDAGDVIATVETDKATIDFVYQDDGYIAKLLVPEGSGNVKVGQLVAIIVDKEADVKAFADYSADAAAQPQRQEEAGGAQSDQAERKATSAPQERTSAPQREGERVFASPLARKTAESQSIDLSQVQGSGPHGRILKHNVDEHASQGGAKKATETQAQAAPTQAAQTKAQPKAATGGFTEAANPYEDIPLTNVREIIAKRLLQSKTTVPHYYLETEINMDEAIKIRTVLNESSKTKISFNDLFVKAASLACIDVPEVNSQWHGNVIRKFKNADVSIAVDTGSGLITPIIFAANAKGLNEISQTTKELAEKAKKNTLKPHEFQGGTFSISNLGMFGISNFAAVINPPQAAILAVGKTDKKVVSVDGNFK
jgi:pyruvate dehydrogenase E2 component (dihydrolipoamide acetyltransferase)